MRANVTVAFTIIVILVVLGACAAPAPTAAPAKPAAAVTPTPVAAPPSAPSPSPSPAPKIKRGGTLRLAWQWNFQTLDPHIDPAGGLTLVYENLTRYDLADEKTGRFEAKPDLAESWEVTDPTTIVMKLRKGVHFQDNSPFDAEAVKWNLERMAKHPKSRAKINVESIKDIQVVDASTIRLNLKAPNADQLALLSTAQESLMGIISKQAGEKLGDDGLATNPVGTGPMTLVEWKRDDHVTLKKWDGYWQKGEDGQPLPYLDGAIYRGIPDPAVMLIELKAGSLDVGRNLEGKDIANVKATPDLVYGELPWSNLPYPAMAFNARSGPFADNLKLRQAALYAIDREGMQKALGFGLGKPSLIPIWQPGLPGWDESIPGYPFNPAKSKQLLGEAGYPNGIDVNLLVDSRAAEQRMGEMIKQMWDQAGIRTTLDVMERLAWLDVVRAGKFQATDWRPVLPFVADQGSKVFQTNAPENYPGRSNPDLDKCLQQGRETYDAKQRQDIYKRCLTIMNEDAYFGSGFLMPRNWVFRKEVKDLRYAFAPLDLRWVWLDR